MLGNVGFKNAGWVEFLISKRSFSLGVFPSEISDLIQAVLSLG